MYHQNYCCDNIISRHELTEYLNFSEIHGLVSSLFEIYNVISLIDN